MKFAHPDNYLGENPTALYWHHKIHSGSFILVCFFKTVINLNLTSGGTFHKIIELLSHVHLTRRKEEAHEKIKLVIWTG